MKPNFRSASRWCLTARLRWPAGLTNWLTFGVAVVGLTATGQAADWQLPDKAPMLTSWSKLVGPTNALPEYPRPQMVRKQWQNLNGLWDYSLTPAATTNPPTEFGARILVPYPYESALSGVAKGSIPEQRLWYRRTFKNPATAQEKVLLHFGAVNWDASVWVNGHAVGTHRGGYDGFTFDITEQLKSGANELVVGAWNPVKADVADAQVLGKQRLHPDGIFYTAASGIWQTVWLEAVPAAHVTDLKLTPDLASETLRIIVDGTAGTSVSVTALDSGRSVGKATGEVGKEFSLAIPSPKLWSPADPHLYGLKVELLQNGKPVDKVDSYFAMRSISLGKDEKGRTKMFLNGKFLFEVGPLDQGYWPDGTYTAPTDAALLSDIAAVKKFGWNTIRKHAKVEPDRWYYWTDRLGLLVWQDMPQMFGGRNGELTAGAKAQFELEWRRIIGEFYNHPSIIVWTTFNEGWGQHDTEEVVALTKKLDPSRLVNNASGWVDKNCGDIHDTHAYPGPGTKMPEEHRAAVNGEFGGVTMSVDAHRWTKNTFGYGSVLKASWLATKRYQDLMKAAYRMRDNYGTSAFIYTQLTDVEQEINGLITYDRAVEKLDLKIVRAANLGEFPPLPPNPNPEWVPTSEEAPIVWSYTTNQPAADWFSPAFDASGWKTGPAVFGHEISGVRTPWTGSDIWIRREFTVVDPIPAKLNLLIKHDEDAEVYINGVLAAKVTEYVGDYKTVPMNPAARDALKAGTNVFAVHCHNTIGGQGIDVGIIPPEKIARP